MWNGMAASGDGSGISTIGCWVVGMFGTHSIEYACENESFSGDFSSNFCGDSGGDI